MAVNGINMKKEKLPPRQMDDGNDKKILSMQKQLTMKPNSMSVLQEIFDLRISKGWTEVKIKHYLMGNPYQYSERTAFRYLQYLREYIKDNTNLDKSELMAAHVNQLEEVALGLKDTNPKLYLAYQQEINKLVGLYEAQKVDITSGGEQIVINLNLNPE
jgi:hypothetical protein